MDICVETERFFLTSKHFDLLLCITLFVVADNNYYVGD